MPLPPPSVDNVRFTKTQTDAADFLKILVAPTGRVPRGVPPPPPEVALRLVSPPHVGGVGACRTKKKLALKVLGS